MAHNPEKYWLAHPEPTMYDSLAGLRLYAAYTSRVELWELPDGRAQLYAWLTCNRIYAWVFPSMVAAEKFTEKWLPARAARVWVYRGSPCS